MPALRFYIRKETSKEKKKNPKFGSVKKKYSMAFHCVISALVLANKTLQSSVHILIFGLKLI